MRIFTAAFILNEIVINNVCLYQCKKNVWNIRKFITQMFDVVRAYILRATQKCFFNLVNKFARRDVENFRHPKFERAKIRWHYVTTIFNITSITTRKRHCDEKKVYRDIGYSSHSKHDRSVWMFDMANFHVRQNVASVFAVGIDPTGG